MRKAVEVKTHTYDTHLHWSGADDGGTKNYRSYSRNHTIGVEGRPDIAASSDPAFRGDPSRYNPEELLVAAISSCHMLWYLHLCAVNGIAVLEYRDRATGSMEEDRGGSGRFVAAVLRPSVTIAPGSDRAKALDLHREAHEMCFVARSLNFPVTVEPAIA